MSCKTKPKKGPFNGHAMISIGREQDSEKYNYGFRNKKCIKTYSDIVSKISGKFINDKIEGDTKIHFTDKSIMKTYIKSGMEYFIILT